MVPFNGNLQTVVLSLLTGLIPSTGGHVGPRFMRVTSVSESVAGATANVTILMDGIRGVLYSQQVRRRDFFSCVRVREVRSHDVASMLSARLLAKVDTDRASGWECFACF